MATDFSNLNVFMVLLNTETNHMVAVEKNYMLDDVEFNDDHLG